MMKHSNLHPGLPVKNKKAGTSGIIEEINFVRNTIKIKSHSDLWKDKTAWNKWLFVHKSDMGYVISFEDFENDFEVEWPDENNNVVAYPPSHRPKGSVFIEMNGEPFKPTIDWPDPTPAMMEDPAFNMIWNVIKTWDINVPEAYIGYCGATGNHVRAILEAFAKHIEPCMD